MRAGWGLGNALFTSTALSIIVGVSTGSLASSITLYEAALGLGIASGPLLGGFLGSMDGDTRFSVRQRSCWQLFWLHFSR